MLNQVSSIRGPLSSNSTPDLHDRVTEAYHGGLGEKFAQLTRARIHWICSQVRGKSVLDVGCSQGIAAILLGREGHKVIGIDAAQRSIEEANSYLSREPSWVQANVEFRNGDFLTSGLGSQRFDTIIFGEILEHLTQPEIFVEAAAKMLVEDGRLIVTVPFGINDWPDHKQTFYLLGPWRLLSPQFDIVEVKLIGKWIGLVARAQPSENTAQASLPDGDILALCEAAFYDIERSTTDERDVLSRELKALHSKHDALAAQKGLMQDRVNQADMARQESERASDALLRRLTEAERTLEASRAEAREAKRELAELRRAHELAQTDHNQQICELREQLEQAQQASRSLDDELARTRAALAVREARMLELQSEADLQSQALAEERGASGELRTKLSETGDYAAALSERLIGLLDELRARTGEIETLRAGVDELRFQGDMRDRERARLSADLAATEEANAELRRDLEAATAREQSEQERGRKAAEELESARKGVAAERHANEELRRQLQEATSRAMKSRTQLDMAQKQKATAEQQAAKAKQTISFQLGYALLHAGQSWRTTVALPRTVLGLLREGRRRERVKESKRGLDISGSPRPPQTTDSGAKAIVAASSRIRISEGDTIAVQGSMTGGSAPIGAQAMLARVHLNDGQNHPLRVNKIAGLAISPSQGLYRYLPTTEGSSQFRFQFVAPCGAASISIEIIPWKFKDKTLSIAELSVERQQRHVIHDQEERAVERWIASNPQASGARFLLYADIDMNVVDGSSVWLSSMASILCSLDDCILITKSDPKTDIITSNIRSNRERLHIFRPSQLGREVMDLNTAGTVIRHIDGCLPSIQTIVVRGVDAAFSLLGTRQFRERALVYLTDFYVVEDAGIKVPPDRLEKLSLCVKQAKAILVQTPAIREKLRELSGATLRTYEVPPPIPDELPEARAVRDPTSTEPLRIGYAGKINPDWGVLELLEWTRRVKASGVAVELHIVANKISGATGRTRVSDFRAQVKRALAEVGAIHHQDFNRERSLRLMAEMDYVWCWRPSRLEDHTLERSTKLVEMIACGARCICYPSKENRTLLGEPYPFFVKDYDDFLNALSRRDQLPSSLLDTVRAQHSFSTIAATLRHDALNISSTRKQRRICFAAHDYKFIDPYVSHLKAAGYQVVRDQWDWGAPRSLSRAHECLKWADIIFCEWGLANAAWYSQNARPGSRLVIRVHLQEINERARKFGLQINISNVAMVVFVSGEVRDRAMEVFGWPKEKTCVVSNFVLADEYQLSPRELRGPIRLGMVGIVPQRKRLDRAVGLVRELQKRGHSVELHIKGHRPEDLDFMRAPGRSKELDYYRSIYELIAEAPSLSESVQFHAWGNNVSSWYHQIDHILSCSDFESFHYALADGVLSGCHPVSWPWRGADEIYSTDWIVGSVEEAAARVEDYRALSTDERAKIALANRSLVADRYGTHVIFPALNGIMDIQH